MSFLEIITLMDLLGVLLYFFYTISLAYRFGVPNSGLCSWYYTIQKEKSPVGFCTIMTIIPLLVLPLFTYISYYIFNSGIMTVVAVIAILLASLIYVFPKYRESHMHTFATIVSRVLFVVWGALSNNIYLLLLPLALCLIVYMVKNLRAKYNIDRRWIFVADFLNYIVFLATPLLILLFI